VAVVAVLLLTVCTADERDATHVVRRRSATSTTLARLHSAVQQIQQLAREVDTVLQTAVIDDETGLMSYKRADGTKKAARRRQDAYSVAGRFGRSIN